MTNVWNINFPHWRRWLGVKHRCVVPFTSVSDIEVLPNGRKALIWSALSDERSLAVFAGIQVRE